MNATLQQSEARALPRWLAPIVQALELDQVTLVTLDHLAAIVALRPSALRQAVSDLIRLGWLRPVERRATYEFIPGAAAGPYPSGDPWLLLRAELERKPGVFHVGGPSAAWLIGYAQRAPEPHIVITTPDVRPPRGLLRTYTVLVTAPAPASATVSGLPVPTPAELFVEVAQLAPRLQLDSAQGWLRRALLDASPEDVAQVLRDRRVSTRARAGYMAKVCGANAHADAIAALGSITGGPYYTGPRRPRVGYAADWQVYDTGTIA